MTCALELRDQKRRYCQRTPWASTLLGLGVALALSGGLPNGELFALICNALTSVVSATLNLLFAFSDLISPLGLYPEALKPVATVGPYPSLLYAPGSIAIDAEPAFLWRGTLALAGWALAATLWAELAFRRTRKTLD